MPFKSKRHSEFEQFTPERKAMPSFSASRLDFSFPFFHAKSLSFRLLPSAFSEEFKRKPRVEENHQCLCYQQMQVNDRLVTALTWRVPACTVNLWHMREMQFMALTGQLCNLKCFAILFSKPSCSVPSAKKARNQTWNVCKAHDSNVCAKDIWHVWTPHPEKGLFSPFSPTLYLSFLLVFPPHSEVWVTLGCTFINNETETPFTAAELVACLEFGFIKASCLLLESSRTCVHSLRLAHKESSIC